MAVIKCVYIMKRLEAQVLHQMTHSNITTYIESFIEGDKLYIVMEYADGKHVF